MFYNQNEFDIRLEWGQMGVEELSPISDAVIIIDILSFSTCVDIVTSKLASVIPYKWKDETAIEFAKSKNTILADFKRQYSNSYSLSPTSLQTVKKGEQIVLPSPNGSSLSLTTGETITLCGCLRNAKAIAEYALQIGKKIAIIPAGEKWSDGSLRPCFEDLIGAGAIIYYLKGTLSPESLTALSAFNCYKENLLEGLMNCISGKELIARGFENDIILAGAFNCSDGVPILQNGKYISG
ncbi:2-phosphosulfolactate phosphatase [Aquiflexum sp.]|uniref:2-phosphosulfolactate phosphatase n=1 Tax=Aquiflexum sp. TaxID=1872584 RepID=UPI003593DC2A